MTLHTIYYKLLFFLAVRGILPSVNWGIDGSTRTTFEDNAGFSFLSLRKGSSFSALTGIRYSKYFGEWGKRGEC